MYSIISLITAAAAFVADQRIKNSIERTLADGEQKEIVNGKIILCKTKNSGAAMNVLEKRKGIVLAVSSAVFLIVMIMYCTVLFKRGSGLCKLGFGLLAGGAASNIYDRWKRSYVVDYFSFSFLRKVVFNVADMCILTGCLITVAAELFKGKVD